MDRRHSFDGGTLATTQSFTTNRAVTLTPGGGTFAAAANTELSQAGSISGTDSLTLVGPGKLTLTGANTHAGTATINTGAALQLGAGAAAAIANNGALIANRANTQTLAAPISGAGSFTQAGTGTTIFAARNTLTSPIALDRRECEFSGFVRP